MFEKAREYLPIFQAHLKRRSTILGFTSGLPWYELAEPLINRGSLFSPTESSSLLVDSIKKFDHKMGCFYEKAVNSRWIDFLTRKGKTGGVLCTNVTMISENIIHLNFGGTISDIRVMGHELGHAYHSWLLDDYLLIFRDPPTPPCKISSIFNEIIFQESLIDTELDNDRAVLIDSCTIDNVHKMVEKYSRLLFEDKLIEHRMDHELS